MTRVDLRNEIYDMFKEFQLKIEAQLADFENEIKRRFNDKKEEPQKKYWIPKENEKYIFISIRYTVEKSSNYIIQQEYANCYSMSEEKLAKRDADVARARQTIQRCADMLHSERYYHIKGKDNYYVFLHDDGDLLVGSHHQVKTDTIYSDTNNLAEKCLELCKKDYRVLLCGESYAD